MYRDTLALQYFQLVSSILFVALGILVWRQYIRFRNAVNLPLAFGTCLGILFFLPEIFYTLYAILYYLFYLPLHMLYHSTIITAIYFPSHKTILRHVFALSSSTVTCFLLIRAIEYNRKEKADLKLRPQGDDETRTFKG